MMANPLGIVAIALAFVCFTGAFLEFRGKPTSKRITWLVIFALLGTPAVLFAAYYLHIIPETEAFYEFRSWPGTELFAVFVGAFAGIITTFLPRLLFALPLVGMAGTVSVPFIKPIIGPLPDNAFRNAWSETVCLQSTPSTCGPASVATIVRQFGIPTSEMEAARGAYSYRRGTEAWYLARYVRRMGLCADYRFENGFCPDINLPAVAGVRVGSIGHFIAIIKREGDTYIIGDPLSGKEFVTEEELLKRYQFTGFYMAISKE